MLHRAQICWVSGPWPSGKYSDLRIFRLGMKHHLDKEEYVVADGTYSDEKCLQPTGRHHPAHQALTLIRARHENVNARLKIFNVLTSKFRHSIHRHRACFMAVVNVTCLSVELEPLFDIELDQKTEL